MFHSLLRGGDSHARWQHALGALKRHVLYGPPLGLTCVFAVAFLLSAALVGWLGYRAVDGWQRSAAQSASHRAAAAADLLATALTRDMRALQIVVLPSMHGHSWTRSGGARAAATAFAKYPYPSVLFAWDESQRRSKDVTFYVRADRTPTNFPLCRSTTVQRAIGSSHASRATSRLDGRFRYSISRCPGVATRWSHRSRIETPCANSRTRCAVSWST